MESKIVESTAAAAEKGCYTELMVLSSAAGYYVGTMYVEDGFEGPGSRDSDYFKTREKAER